MPTQIVVSVRTSHAGLAEAGDTYLARARGVLARAEALGATLAGWSAMTFAVAWDADSIEEAITYAVSLLEEPPTPEQAWACGVSEGDMEPLAPTGQRAELAWGNALVVATSLARIAVPGEVLLDGDVRALRAGELSTSGTRTSTDAGRRIRGWKLDLAQPWRRPHPSRGPKSSARAPRVAPPSFEATPELVGQDLETTARILLPPSHDADRTDEHPSLALAEGDYDYEEAPSSALELADAGVVSDAPAAWNDVTDVGPPPLTTRNGSGAPKASLADRVQSLAQPTRGEGESALIALRRARARAEQGPSESRCHASLALAVALVLAGRHEDALLEGLDALARAREAADARATAACLALLAKVYAASGHEDAAALLRTAAKSSPSHA